MTAFESNDRSIYKGVDRQLVAKIQGLAKPSFAESCQRPGHERSRAAASKAKEREQRFATRFSRLVWGAHGQQCNVNGQPARTSLSSNASARLGLPRAARVSKRTPAS